MIAMDGSIGTWLFVSISLGLSGGGPDILLTSFILYGLPVALVNNSIAEIRIYQPVSRGSVHIAVKWAYDAFSLIA